MTVIWTLVRLPFTLLRLLALAVLTLVLIGLALLCVAFSGADEPEQPYRSSVWGEW